MKIFDSMKLFFILLQDNFYVKRRVFSYNSLSYIYFNIRHHPLVIKIVNGINNY